MLVAGELANGRARLTFSEKARGYTALHANLAGPRSLNNDDLLLTSPASLDIECLVR